MRLLVFSGLPGTGKTTLAEALAREMGIPVFAFDWLLSVIVPLECSLARIRQYVG